MDIVEIITWFCRWHLGLFSSVDRIYAAIHKAAARITPSVTINNDTALRLG